MGHIPTWLPSYKHTLTHGLCLPYECQAHPQVKSHTPSQGVKRLYLTSMGHPGSQGPLLGAGSWRAPKGETPRFTRLFHPETAHVDTGSQPWTQPHRMSHTPSITLGFGGLGRAPGGGYVNTLLAPPRSSSPPPCFLTQCQRPGRLGRGPGTARPRGGSRRREIRS